MNCVTPPLYSAYNKKPPDSTLDSSRSSTSPPGTGDQRRRPYNYTSLDHQDDIMKRQRPSNARNSGKDNNNNNNSSYVSSDTSYESNNPFHPLLEGDHNDREQTTNSNRSSPDSDTSGGRGLTYRISTPSNKHGFKKQQNKSLNNSSFVLNSSSKDTQPRHAHKYNGNGTTNTTDFETFQDETDDMKLRAAAVVSPSLSTISKGTSRAPTPTISNTSFRSPTTNATMNTTANTNSTDHSHSGTNLNMMKMMATPSQNNLSTSINDGASPPEHSSLMDTMHVMETSGAPTPQSSLMDTMHLVSIDSSSCSSAESDEDDDEDQIAELLNTKNIGNKNRDACGSNNQKRTSQMRQFVNNKAQTNQTENTPDTTSEDPQYYHPAYWNARLGRREVYSRMYRPNRDEIEELQEVEQFLGIPEARRSRKNIIVQQWRKLNPSTSQAAQQNIPMSIVLKRGPVAWASHEECELILLTRGFVVARKVFQYIPRFQLGEVWTNVENIAPSGLTSFTITCNDMKTLEFVCPTASELQAWMNALRVVVLQAYTHQASFLDTDDDDDWRYQPGWQYKLVQTPWFSEAVTGEVQLESNMLDHMDNRELNVLDSYNQCAPLHYATKANHPDAMRFLLQAGADPNLPDGMGQTPMHYAEADFLPKSTTDLLASYGGKSPNASNSCVSKVSMKDTSRRCRRLALTILLLLLVATGVTTFLIWYLSRDSSNSASSLESESSTTSLPDDVEGEEELLPVNDDELQSSSPPPFLVVGVNPIPATNLTTEPPTPTFSSNSNIAPTGNPTTMPTSTASKVPLNDTLESESDAVSSPSATPNPGPSPRPIDPTTAMPSSNATQNQMSGVPTNTSTQSPTSLRTTSPTDEELTVTPTLPPTNFVTFTGSGSLLTETPTAGPTPSLDAAPTIGSSTSQPTVGPLALTASPTLTPDDYAFDLLVGPTSPPTFESIQQAVELLPEDILLFEFLVDRSLDSGRALRNPKSAQYQAFRWLSGNMELSTYSDERKIQRYALATVYFSTAGDDWINNQFWLSDADECTVWFSRIAEIATDAVCNERKEYVTLDLDYNNLRGRLPKEVALLTSLHRVELYGGPQGFLTGTLPTEIGLLSQLESLSVRGNRMSGQIPSELGKCTPLDNLSLSQNRFSGSIPTTIGTLNQLATISFETNRLSGTMPSELGSIGALKSITLGTNALTGKIFTEIGLLTNLQGLDLEMNQLSSEIPTEVGLLSNLSLLHLSLSGVRGTIPATIGGMESMASLKLRGNALISSIPSSIGRLVNMGALDLSFNELSGSIPSEIGNASLLRSLLINSNQLEGTLPSEVANLSRLNTFRMELNNMSGEVPIEVCDVFSNTYPMFYADCLEVSCSCCSYCCIDAAGCSCEYEGTQNEFLC